MSSIILVDKLKKQYESSPTAALAGISFDVKEGEIFSLLGPNGAGKTTTISILTGLLQPSSGDAQLCGYSVLSDSFLVKKNIGIVPQEIALYPMISVRQNLTFFARIYGLRGKALQDSIHRVLEQVNLTERSHDKVSHLSGGMQRRLNIAVALLHNPKILFMDEPTVGIDPQNRNYLLDTIKELNKNGMTIFYTSHYMEEVQDISHRIGIIDHGEIVALGTHQQLLDQVEQHHTVSFNVDNVNICGSFRNQFGQHPEMTEIMQNGKSLQFKTHNPNGIIVTILNALGGHLSNLNIQSPNLESVFLTLTGNKLRD